MDRPASAVSDWGQAVMGAVGGALATLLAFIPTLIGALIILLVGWIIAKVLSALVTKALRVIRFNQIADRAEIDQFLDKSGVRMDPAAVVGTLAYWFLMLVFLGAAFNTLGLQQLTNGLNAIIGYIPNVVVAMVMLLVGALLANFVANLVRGTAGSARVGDPNLLATVARGAIMVFALMMALDQLHVAPTIIQTLWTALIGAVAVAGALAFGLGGRDVAKRMLEDWYNKRSSLTGALRETAQQPSRYAATATSPTPTLPGNPALERTERTEGRRVA